MANTLPPWAQTVLADLLEYGPEVLMVLQAILGNIPESDTDTIARVRSVLPIIRRHLDQLKAAPVISVNWLTLLQAIIALLNEAINPPTPTPAST